MNKFIRLSTFTALCSGLFLITGCSSSGDGGSGPGAGVPANAITIADSITAETTISTAVASGTVFISAIGIETSTTVTGRDILNIVLEKMNNNKNTTHLATGTVFNDSCLAGSISVNETGTEEASSVTINFNACNVGGGLIFNGGISGSQTSTLPSGPYTINITGNLTITFDGSNESVGFNGFTYVASGNDSTGDYTVTTFTYAIAPSSGGGFAVELSRAFVGNDSLPTSCQLSSGQVLVTGAAGSQARGTVNANGTVKVEYHSGDGNFVESDNSPVGCLL